VGPFLDQLISDVTSNESIEVFLNAGVCGVDGFIGNFKTTIQSGGDSQVLEHGVTLIASGAEEYKPDDDLYGRGLKKVQTWPARKKEVGPQNRKLPTGNFPESRKEPDIRNNKVSDPINSGPLF
jgi:hypothetical protein